MYGRPIASLIGVYFLAMTITASLRVVFWQRTWQPIRSSSTLSLLTCQAWVPPSPPLYHRSHHQPSNNHLSDRRTLRGDQFQQRWMTTTSSPSADASDATTSSSLKDKERKNMFPNERAAMLHDELLLIGIDAEGLHQAAIVSIQDSMAGYNATYGRPAIRTYRSFVFPKAKNRPKQQQKQSSIFDNPDANDNDGRLLLLRAAVGRTARQIDFLIKRQASHQAEWVRHHDVQQQASSNSNTTRFPLILVLDNLRSAYNVGSLFRTADACGCEAVYTTGITPHPHGSGADKVAKSALGADLLVPTQHFATTVQALEYLRETNHDTSTSIGTTRRDETPTSTDRHNNTEPPITILAMETTEHSVPYTELDYRSHSKVALVLGNEVTGVDTEILSSTGRLDGIVEIPMFGSKNSLNVAACAPIVLYEIIRQWKKNEASTTHSSS